MNILHAIINFLEGKKSLILAILGLVLSYLVKDGTLSPNLGLLLQSALSLVAGGAVAVGATESYRTFQLGKSITLPPNPTI